MALSDTVRRIRQRQEPDVDRNEEIKRWRADVEGLFGTIRGWLKPALDEGLVLADVVEEPIEEEDLGHYSMNSLRIRIGKDLVTLKPIARFAMGSDGILFLDRAGHLDAGSIIQRFMKDTTTGWRIKARPVNEKPVDLDETTFEKALERLFA